MNWYLKALKQYADFHGRARRTEFWMFTLVNIIISLLLSSLDYFFGTYYLFSGIYGLAMLIPGLAVTVRRLHDTGKSGWMILVGLIPVLGALWLFILMIMDSQPGENKYGPNPKEVVVTV